MVKKSLARRLAGSMLASMSWGESNFPMLVFREIDLIGIVAAFDLL